MYPAHIARTIWQQFRPRWEEGGIEFTNGDEPGVKLTAKKGEAKRWSKSVGSPNH